MDVLTDVTTPNVRNYRGQLPFDNGTLSFSEKNKTFWIKLKIYFRISHAKSDLYLIEC